MKNTATNVERRQAWEVAVKAINSPHLSADWDAGDEARSLLCDADDSFRQLVMAALKTLLRKRLMQRGRVY